MRLQLARPPNAIIVKPLIAFSQFVLGWLGEGFLIRGSAWLLAGIATLLGEFVRRWQSGNLRSYAGWLAAGAAVLLLAALYFNSHVIPGFNPTHLLQMELPVRR